MTTETTAPQSEPEVRIEVIESKIDLTKDELKQLRASRDQLTQSLASSIIQRNNLDSNIKQLNALLSGLDKVFKTK